MNPHDDIQYGGQMPYGHWTVEYVTLTGDVQNGQVGCSAFGATFYARPIFNTAFQSIPSQNWLAKYSKQFFGVIIYEKNIKERPLFLGVVPNDSTTNYQEPAVVDRHKIQTENYAVIIDDQNEEILVGSESATEPVPLGNQLVDALQNLGQILQDATTNTSLGPQPFEPTTQAALSEWVNGLNQILSQVIKVI